LGRNGDAKKEIEASAKIHAGNELKLNLPGETHQCQIDLRVVRVLTVRIAQGAEVQESWLPSWRQNCKNMWWAVALASLLSTGAAAQATAIPRDAKLACGWSGDFANESCGSAEVSALVAAKIVRSRWQSSDIISLRE
jgi:hypothetical protein